MKTSSRRLLIAVLALVLLGSNGAPVASTANDGLAAHKICADDGLKGDTKVVCDRLRWVEGEEERRVVAQARRKCSTLLNEQLINICVKLEMAKLAVGGERGRSPIASPPTANVLPSRRPSFKPTSTRSPIAQSFADLLKPGGGDSLAALLGGEGAKLSAVDLLNSMSTLMGRDDIDINQFGDTLRAMFSKGGQGGDVASLLGRFKGGIDVEDKISWADQLVDIYKNNLATSPSSPSPISPLGSNDPLHVPDAKRGGITQLIQQEISRQGVQQLLGGMAQSLLGTLV